MAASDAAGAAEVSHPLTSSTTSAAAVSPGAAREVVLRDEPLPDLDEMCRAAASPLAYSMTFKGPKGKAARAAWWALGLGGAAVAYRCIGGAASLAAAALSYAVPRYFLNRKAKRIAAAWIPNRQDAFKSARNLLAERIERGRARRLRRCDVYYPPEEGKGGDVDRRRGRRSERGLVFYPGALVDRTAYAPIMSRMSDAGIVVAVANLEPFRIRAGGSRGGGAEELANILRDALLPAEVPDDVDFEGGKATVRSGGLVGPEPWTVDGWAVGGHSMGAAWAAERVLESSPSPSSPVLDRFVSWGAIGVGERSSVGRERYSALRDVPGLRALVVCGTNDALVGSIGPKKREEHEAFLPPREAGGGKMGGGPPSSSSFTLFVAVEGGNHSSFAHYGPQTFSFPEGDRTITLEEQQRIAAEATVHFLLEA